MSDYIILFFNKYLYLSKCIRYDLMYNYIYLNIRITSSHSLSLIIYYKRYIQKKFCIRKGSIKKD